MEETAAVYFQLAATEFPIRAQQEVIPEDSVLEVVQNSPADEAKVGEVLFPFARIAPPAVTATAELQRNRAGVLFEGSALPKTVETGTKNGPKYAIARHFLPYVDKAYTVALAVCARHLCQPNCVRSIPLHFENVLLAAALKRRAGAIRFHSFSNSRST
jgi:hypothetical protein